MICEGEKRAKKGWDPCLPRSACHPLSGGPCLVLAPAPRLACVLAPGRFCLPVASSAAPALLLVGRSRGVSGWSVACPLLVRLRALPRGRLRCVRARCSFRRPFYFLASALQLLQRSLTCGACCFLCTPDGLRPEAGPRRTGPPAANYAEDEKY